MTIITNEHELAADTHVDTTDKHDRPGDHAPEQQEEKSSEIIQGVPELLCQKFMLITCLFFELET